MGHVNNTIYFRYLEIVPIECLRRRWAADGLFGVGDV